MPRRSSSTLRALVVLTAVSALGFGLVAPAGAAPADGVPSRAAAQGTRDLGVLNEQYNRTRLELDWATVALHATEARLEATKARAERVQQTVRDRAASLYTGAAGDGVAAMLDAGTVNELGRRTQYVSAAAKPDRVLLRSLTRTQHRLATEQRAATEARDRLRAQAEAAAAARRKLMAEAAAAAAAARVTSRVDGAGPVGTPRAMLVASSSTGSARTGASPSVKPAPAPHRPSPPPATPPPSTPTPSRPIPTPPAPSSRAATAVAFARAQLGKPYAFATAGPNTFDCSGLTMAAWRAAGVSMQHYSGSQAASFPKVGWSQLQPGDIVVFYADLHHVGLYIGNGQMIHAPQTGDVVKIAPAWRETFQFGVRPR